MIELLKTKTTWLILVITLMAFGLRFYQVATVPPGLGWDEISQGYNAYSVLKTGHDEWGQFLPIANFRAYGDYPLPLYLYLTIPSIIIFGLNAFSIRLISVLFGTMLVPVVYLLGKQLFKNPRIAMISALLVAVSPWAILTSRQVLQATPALLFFSLGILLFLKGLQSKRYLVLIGTFSLGLSAYAYHNTRILAPLLLVLLILLFKERLLKNKKILIWTLVVGAIFFLPLIPILLSPSGSARSTWVGIIDQGAINQLNQARGGSQFPSLVTKLIYNKQTFFAFTAATNYIGYFNPSYLGLTGGTNNQFSVPDFGIVYLIELPFFYLGLILLLFKLLKSDPNHKLVVGWLLLGFVPAAITKDPNQVVRSMVALPAFYLIVGYGFSNCLKTLTRDIKPFRIGLGLVCLMILISEFANYYSNMLTTYPTNYSYAWQYGYEQVAEYIQANGSQYQQIAITKKYGEPHEFMLFYLKYDPQSYMNDPNLVRYSAYNWYWVDRFNKFEFVNDEDIKKDFSQSTGGATLLVTSPGNYPDQAKVLERVNFLDGKGAFDIVEL